MILRSQPNIKWTSASISIQQRHVDRDGEMRAESSFVVVVVGLIIMESFRTGIRPGA